jgi:hypothetical protein
MQIHDAASAAPDHHLYRSNQPSPEITVQRALCQGRTKRVKMREHTPPPFHATTTSPRSTNVYNLIAVGEEYTFIAFGSWAFLFLVLLPLFMASRVTTTWQRHTYVLGL